MKKYYLIFLLSILIISCQNRADNYDYNKLALLDSLIENNELPAAIDSLKSIQVNNLSHLNLAYYQLLDTRIKDKTYYNFTSDSLINSAEKFFSGYKNKAPRLYALSLMYQGVVRYRMGITDSTAYMPLKEAIDVFNEKIPLDIKNLHLANLYTGLIHDNHADVKDAYYYLKEAVRYAKIDKNSDYLHYDYTELVWNRLKADDLEQAKLYLDTLKSYNFSQQKLHLYIYINSVYLSYNKEYMESIQQEKKLVDLIQKNDSNMLYKIYYGMSNNYEALKDYKNAFVCSQVSNLYLKDKAENVDYLLYKQLGDLALKAGKKDESISAYQKAYLLLNKSVNQRIDKNILEIEKKYNYTKIENEKLKVQKKLQAYLFISSSILLLFLLCLLLINRNRIKEKSRRLILENEKIKLESEEERLKRIDYQKTWVNSVYAFISEDNNEQMDAFYKLKMNGYIKENKSVYQLIKNQEENYKNRIKEVSSLLLDEDTFLQLTGLNKKQMDLLNYSDKLLYALLQCNLNYNQIAALMGSTYNSIRIRRKYLLDKLSLNGKNNPQKLQI